MDGQVAPRTPSLSILPTMMLVVRAEPVRFCQTFLAIQASFNTSSSFAEHEPNLRPEKPFWFQLPWPSSPADLIQLVVTKGPWAWVSHCDVIPWLNPPVQLRWKGKHRVPWMIPLITHRNCGTISGLNGSCDAIGRLAWIRRRFPATATALLSTERASTRPLRTSLRWRWMPVDAGDPSGELETSHVQNLLHLGSQAPSTLTKDRGQRSFQGRRSEGQEVSLDNDTITVHTFLARCLPEASLLA